MFHLKGWEGSVTDMQHTSGSLQGLQSWFCWWLNGHGQVSFCCVSTCQLPQLFCLKADNGCLSPRQNSWENQFISSWRVLLTMFSISKVCISRSLLTGKFGHYLDQSQTGSWVFCLAMRRRDPKRCWCFVHVGKRREKRKLPPWVPVGVHMSASAHSFLASCWILAPAPWHVLVLSVEGEACADCQGLTLTPEVGCVGGCAFFKTWLISTGEWGEGDTGKLLLLFCKKLILDWTV